MIHLLLLLIVGLFALWLSLYVGLLLLGLVLAVITWPIRTVIEFAKRRSS